MFLLTTASHFGLPTIFDPQPNDFQSSDFRGLGLHGLHPWQGSHAVRQGRSGGSLALVLRCGAPMVPCPNSICVKLGVSTRKCKTKKDNTHTWVFRGHFFLDFPVSSKNNAHFIQKRSIGKKPLNWKVVLVRVRTFPLISRRFPLISRRFPLIFRETTCQIVPNQDFRSFGVFPLKI